MYILKARSIAVFQSFKPLSELTLTMLMEASNDMEKVTIPITAFIFCAPLEIPPTSVASSQIISIMIREATVNTKIGFAKFIPLTETKTNIAAVVRVAPLSPVKPSFSSISIIMKPIKEP